MAKDKEGTTVKTTVYDVPSNMIKSDTDVDDFPPWDFDRGPLNGKVIKIKTVDLLRRGEEVEVRLAIVEDISGEKHALWESANLQNFFDDISAGSTIHVVLVGKTDLKGGRSMNLFEAYHAD